MGTGQTTRTILIILTDDQSLVNGVIDLATGRAQAQLDAVLSQTGDVLKQAQAINTQPPKEGA